MLGGAQLGHQRRLRLDGAVRLRHLPAQLGLSARQPVHGHPAGFNLPAQLRLVAGEPRAGPLQRQHLLALRLVGLGKLPLRMFGGNDLRPQLAQL
ncbi:hypothetical protein [Thauera aromatica]|uniref:hypothetical protein n=1 Tax=Thauera aromatica TaxID=59405 RepID=UPI001FFD7C69|nr:hypothetical protein [Thauera aromatica]MCK2097675.1 hypothetical protein [Thauera aromatica]